MRLSDLYACDADGRRRLTWRELGVYVRQLPPDARTRVATGDTDGVWGLEHHLQALAIDELRVANWQRGNEGVKPGKQSPKPKPVERPGSKSKRADRTSPERVAARARARMRAAERTRALAAGEIT